MIFVYIYTTSRINNNNNNKKIREYTVWILDIRVVYEFIRCMFVFKNADSPQCITRMTCTQHNLFKYTNFRLVVFATWFVGSTCWHNRRSTISVPCWTRQANLRTYHKLASVFSGGCCHCNFIPIEGQRSLSSTSDIIHCNVLNHPLNHFYVFILMIFAKKNDKSQHQNDPRWSFKCHKNLLGRAVQTET